MNVAKFIALAASLLLRAALADIVYSNSFIRNVVEATLHNRTKRFTPPVLVSSGQRRRCSADCLAAFAAHVKSTLAHVLYESQQDIDELCSAGRAYRSCLVQCGFNNDEVGTLTRSHEHSCERFYDRQVELLPCRQRTNDHIKAVCGAKCGPLDTAFAMLEGLSEALREDQVYDRAVKALQLVHESCTFLACLIPCTPPNIGTSSLFDFQLPQLKATCEGDRLVELELEMLGAMAEAIEPDVTPSACLAVKRLPGQLRRLYADATSTQYSLAPLPAITSSSAKPSLSYLATCVIAVLVMWSALGKSVD